MGTTDQGLKIKAQDFTVSSPSGDKWMIYDWVPYHNPLMLGRLKLQETVTGKVLFNQLAEKIDWGRARRC